jgi:hypothetical protein
MGPIDCDARPWSQALRGSMKRAEVVGSRYGRRPGAWPANVAACLAGVSASRGVGQMTLGRTPIKLGRTSARPGDSNGVDRRSRAALGTPAAARKPPTPDERLAALTKSARPRAQRIEPLAGASHGQRSRRQRARHGDREQQRGALASRLQSSVWRPREARSALKCASSDEPPTKEARSKGKTPTPSA